MDELLRQIDIGGDERRAVGGEIHISPPERTRLVVIEFKFISETCRASLTVKLVISYFSL